MPNTSLRRLTTKTLPKIQSKRLTTKILQVRHSQRKFLSKVRVTHTEGNPAQGPLIISTREIPLQRSKQHCSLMEIPLQVRRTLFNEENIYYNLLPTVYYYNYILFIFSQVKYTNTTRDRRIQGEHRRSGASFWRR